MGIFIPGPFVRGGANVIAARDTADDLALGVIPAATGNLRLPHFGGLVMRNNLDTADVGLVHVSGSDGWFGSLGGVSRCSNNFSDSSLETWLLVAGTGRFRVTAARALLNLPTFTIDAAVAASTWSQAQAAAGAGVDWTKRAQASAAASGSDGGNYIAGGGAGDGAGFAGFMDLLTFILFAHGDCVNQETLGADKTMDRGEALLHAIDAGGAARNLTATADLEGQAGAVFIIWNTGGENLVFRNSVPANIVTVAPAELCIVGHSVASGWVALGPVA